MKSIRLYLQKPIKIYVIFSLAILSLVGFWLMNWFLKTHALKDLPTLIISLILLFLTFWWISLMTRIPHTINFLDDNSYEFQSSARKIILSSSDIISIRPWAGGIGFFTLRHRKGKIILLNQFDGFHELLHMIKKENSAVELRGC